MRLSALALTLTLGLAACASPEPVPPPTPVSPSPLGPPLTPEEIAARYVDSPPDIPPESAAPLGPGIDIEVQGRVPHWKGTADTTIHAQNGHTPWSSLQDPGPVLGTIAADGRFVLTLPTVPLDGPTAEQLMLSPFSLGAERCFVDTLAADPPNTRLTLLHLVTRNTFPRVPEFPPRGPIPNFLTVVPYGRQPAVSGIVHLVFTEHDVVVRGERRCLPLRQQFRDLMTLQRNLAVNLRLSRGWNVVKMSTRDVTVGLTQVHTVRFEGAPNEVTPVPR